MTDKELSELLDRYAAGKCTPEEQLQLHSWYDDLDRSSTNVKLAAAYEEVRDRMYARLVGKSLRVKRVHYWRVAAAIAFFIVAGGGYLLLNVRKHNTSYAKHQVQDVPAITNKAILTLANGQQIILDSAGNGTIANQGGITVTKNNKGQVVYNISSGNSAPSLPSASLPQGERGQIAYNTVTTPNGGQYQVILPDGSHVWLNAASSLKYPVLFNGTQRNVELSGEGYFEVSKDPKRPFIVFSSNQSIKVLGTHFNVSAYAGEPIVTTLAEGKVEISSPIFPQKSILKPGDQSTNTAAGLSIAKVNPDDIIAWKDGLFVFNNTDLKDVMRQIARCYNVEVDYSAIPDMKYDGEISRNTTLLKVLKFIEAGSEVPLKLEGRRITRK